LTRIDGRKFDELREISIKRNYIDSADGSVLICFGKTKVIVTAKVEETVPHHKRNSGEGWLTAEYNMLPASSNERIKRERFKVSGRTYEIQRLIGRSLRMAVDLKLLGERSINIDADVIQADGGTRTASITGAYFALQDAVQVLLDKGIIKKNPLIEKIAAISVGVFEGKPVLDLNYHEDSRADVDMNVIMTQSGKLVELQGTAENEPFSRDTLNSLLDLAQKGLTEIFNIDYKK